MEKVLTEFEKSYEEQCYISIPEADAFLREYQEFKGKLLRIE